MNFNKLMLGICFLGMVATAQKVKKEELFTIDNKPYYSDEFVRVYKKNLDLVKDESQKDLDQYLELFIGYKLKINKAYKLGLEKGGAYHQELNQYRDQLAKGYMTDTKVTKELVDEAYQRSLKEIRASHILILADENAVPADTLKAWNKIQEVYKKAAAGEDFDKLAEQYSQDPSAKENKGDLGYFSAFRMVYPFENAAYKTAKGQVSKPFRTRFGYHILKVDDVRDNRGEVSVAHIMVLSPADADEATKAAAKQKIFDVYQKLQQGENFESLAKQFSDDKSSSSKGGVLNRFGSGQLSSEEFENVAFSLSKDKPLSEPFQSAFGWHIVKFIDRYPVKTLAEMQAELESKVSKDDRSKLIAESMSEKLHKKYNVKRNDKMYKAVKATVTDDYYKSEWKKPNLDNFKDKLLTVKDSVYPASNFVNYLFIQQKAGHTEKPIGALVDKVYAKYEDEQLNSYYKGDLEKEFPEFAAVMDEYRDGLLLFDLMEKEIWQRSKTDTLGLKAYFEQNKANYSWKNRADVVIASSTSQDVIKEARKMLQKDAAADAIKQKLNVKDKVNVMTTSGTFEEGNDALPKGMKFEKGVSEIIKDGDYYFVVKVNKVMPAGPKTLDEAKGKVVNDYQQSLEENWVKDLRKEFTVVVNRPNFEELKKEMKQ
ncbi:peptidylprolyl isomerase [Flavobacterium silvaticum]|uniref:Peptidylprolyl isomerase n=1 Tax=Flavobacterium silvaticum TaxID=1852020 RepID=A0A972FML0_9FLAO|nr:peptidylprolyl isomerase [Flavobacterium silvaticum]NMH28000.1 peptidylprolyl isomerase [Flavobacterium silvaticum]